MLTCLNGLQRATLEGKLAAAKDALLAAEHKHASDVDRLQARNAGVEQALQHDKVGTGVEQALQHDKVGAGLE